MYVELWSGDVGERVYVPPGPSSAGLPCRTGRVEEAHPGGAFVRHDDGARFGWGWSELAPIERAPWWLRSFGRMIGLVLRRLYRLRWWPWRP